MLCVLQGYVICQYTKLCFVCLDVLLGEYLGMQVAVKVLKDKSMVQQFLAEAYVMTYVAVTFTVLGVVVEY